MADEWKYGNRVDGDEVSFNDTSYVVRKDTDQTVYDAVGSTTSDQDYTNVLSRLKALENANNTGVNGYGTIEFWTREQQDADFITTSASTTIPKTRDKRALNVSDRLTMKNGATPSAAIVSITSSNLSACSERASVAFLPPDDPGVGDLGSRLVTCWSGSNLTNSAGAVGGGTGNCVVLGSIGGTAWESEKRNARNGSRFTIAQGITNPSVDGWAKRAFEFNSIFAMPEHDLPASFTSDQGTFTRYEVSRSRDFNDTTETRGYIYICTKVSGNCSGGSGSSGGGSGTWEFNLKGRTTRGNSGIQHYNLDTLSTSHREGTAVPWTEITRLGSAAAYGVYAYQEGDIFHVYEINGSSVAIDLTTSYQSIRWGSYIKYSISGGQAFIYTNFDLNQEAAFSTAKVRVIRQSSASSASTPTSKNANDILFDQVIVPVDPNTGKFTLYTSLGISTLGDETKIYIATTGLIGAGDSSGSGGGTKPLIGNSRNFPEGSGSQLVEGLGDQTLDASSLVVAHGYGDASGDDPGFNTTMRLPYSDSTTTAPPGSQMKKWTGARFSYRIVNAWYTSTHICLKENVYSGGGGSGTRAGGEGSANVFYQIWP